MGELFSAAISLIARENTGRTPAYGHVEMRAAPKIGPFRAELRKIGTGNNSESREIGTLRVPGRRRVFRTAKL